MDSRLEELTAYCQQAGGDSLQSVFTMTADSGEVHYIRDDMRAAFSSGGFERFREAAWEVHDTVLVEAPKIQVLGGYRVTVHTFERAFAMQFRISNDQGLVITFDRDIGRNLHEFLLECERFL